MLIFPEDCYADCSCWDLQQLLILVLIKSVALNCLVLTFPAQSSAALGGDQALLCALRALRMCCRCGHTEMSHGRWGLAVSPSCLAARRSWRHSLICRWSSPGLYQRDGERDVISNLSQVRLDGALVQWRLSLEERGATK